VGVEQQVLAGLQVDAVRQQVPARPYPWHLMQAAVLNLVQMAFLGALLVSFPPQQAPPV